MRRFLRRWYCWLPALLVGAGLGYVGYRVDHPVFSSQLRMDLLDKLCRYLRLRLVADE